MRSCSERSGPTRTVLQHLLVLVVLVVAAVLTGRLGGKTETWVGFSAVFTHIVRLSSSHLLLEDVSDHMTDLLEVSRVPADLLLAGLDQAVHGFQDAHDDLPLAVHPHLFHETRKNQVQKLQQG